MTVRVYLPYSLHALDELARSTDGIDVPQGSQAYAVTDAARAAHPGTDEEELEYLAMATAALESSALLHDAEPQRRLVLAVDADSADPAADEDDVFAVRVSGLRLPADVAAYHLDDAAAERDVARARLAWKNRQPGWEELVSRTAGHELGWYAPTELSHLLAVYAGRRSS